MPPKQPTEKVGRYSLNQKFPGFHAREDPTLLPAGTMVYPSQNVVIGTSGRVGSVPGYTLDGQGSVAIDSGILSNYDFQSTSNGVKNLRCGFLTSAGSDGKLQFRYESATGAVSWIDLRASLSNVRLSFASFYDATTALNGTGEIKSLCLWVDGSNSVFEWNGAVTTYASSTSNTITKQGASTWAQAGFYFGRNKKVIIGGTEYTYTGGESTTTLTGVTPDPSGAGYAAGAEIHQSVVVTALSSMTAISSSFAPTVIGCGRKDQVYLGSASSSILYISKEGNFKDYSYTSPTRLVGEGYQLVLDYAPTGFIPLEVVAASGGTSAYDMYVSEGLNTWSIVRSTITSVYDSSGVASRSTETIEHIRMKVAPLQGAISERLMGKMQNHIMFVGNDNVGYFYGYNSYEYIPSSTDFSYPIIDDMKSYDFADAQVFSHRNYIYLSVPNSGLIRVYNMTDQTREENSSYKGIEDVTGQPWFWEAPIGYPIAGFYTVDGEIYGHSFTTSESYKLFDGGSFNGQDIAANATFAFDDKGDRTQSKASDELWVEGYIKQNTILSCTVAGDLDYFQTSQTALIDGSDSRYVAFGGGAHSLGTNSLGSQPLGGAQTSRTTLPAWFHVARTYPNIPCYLEQLSFSSKGVDLQWELISFGTNSTFTAEGNNAITI